MRVLVLLSLSSSLAACGDDVVRAPVTIVVDTDRARAIEDQARLRELQQGVQGDRAVLEKARADLAEARRQLAAAVSADEKRRLEERVAALSAQVPLSSSSSSPLTAEDLDARLRAFEERLRTIIAEEIARAASSPKGPAAVDAPAVDSSLDRARALLAGARRSIAAQRLDVLDVVGADALLVQAEAALAAGQGEQAVEAARALNEKVAAVVIDRALVRRRYERVRRKLDGASAAQRAPVAALLKEAIDSSDRDPPAANVALDNAERLLRGEPARPDAGR